MARYVGNGGTDKLVGVNDSRASLSPDDDFEISEVTGGDE